MTTLEIKKKLQNAITTNHEGKMKLLWSISTSCKDNKQCSINAKIKGSICEKCFAQTLLNNRATLENKLHNNTELLTAEILPLEAMPVIFNQYFRFEAFGDLMNAVQVVNYFNIAKANPLVNCAIWTKNPQFIEQAIKEYHAEKPENLIIVYSSMFLNTPIKNIKSRYPFIDKIFTVYTLEHLKENPQTEINCGGRSCANCLKCYQKNDIVFINELLKQDTKKAIKEGIKIAD